MGISRFTPSKSVARLMEYDEFGDFVHYTEHGGVVRSERVFGMGLGLCIGFLLFSFIARFVFSDIREEKSILIQDKAELTKRLEEYKYIEEIVKVVKADEI